MCGLDFCPSKNMTILIFPRNCNLHLTFCQVFEGTAGMLYNGQIFAVNRFRGHEN